MKWPRVSFEDAVHDATSGNSKVLTSTLSAKGRFPVVDQGQKFISGYLDDKELLCRRSRGAVILFGDHTKALKYVDFDFVLGADGVKVLEAKDGFNPRFLFHYLSTISLPNNLGYSRYFKYLKLATVPKPSPHEQCRIVAILDKADAIRKKRREALKLADEFLRSVFLDMFGDPATNPKGWPIYSLGSLCTIQTGATPDRLKASYYGGDIPWVKTGEVDQDLIINTEERITESGVKETNCKIFPVETILIAMYGQGKTRGKCGMLGISAATNQACAAILPTNSINSTYLYQLLKASYEAIRNMGRGGNQENLNLGMIKNLDIIVPPATLQMQFAEIVKKATRIKSMQLTLLADAESLFASISRTAWSSQL